MRKFIICLILLCLPNLLTAQGIQEFETYALGAQSEDPNELMISTYLVEQKLDEIETKFIKQWNRIQKKINAEYEPEFQALEELKPKLWETDAEFDKRIAHKRATIQAELDEELSVAEQEISKDYERSKMNYEVWRATAYDNLSGVRTVPDGYIEVTSRKYLRNEREWYLQIACNHQIVSFEELTFVVDFEAERNTTGRDTISLQDEIIDFDEAVQTGQLQAEIQWEIIKYEDRFNVGIKEIAIKNKLNNLRYATEYDDLLAVTSYMGKGDTHEDVQLIKVPVVRSVEFPKSEFKVEKGERKKLLPNVYPENARYEYIGWEIQEYTTEKIIDEAGNTNLEEDESLIIANIIISDSHFALAYPFTFFSSKVSTWREQYHQIRVEPYKSVEFAIAKDDTIGAEAVYVDGKEIGETPLHFEVDRDEISLQIGDTEKQIDIDLNLAGYEINPKNNIPYQEPDYPDFLPALREVPEFEIREEERSYLFTAIGAITSGSLIAYQLHSTLESNGEYEDLSSFYKWANIINVGVGGIITGASFGAIIDSFIGIPILTPVLSVAGIGLAIRLYEEFEGNLSSEEEVDELMFVFCAGIGGALWGAITGAFVDSRIEESKRITQEEQLRQKIKEIEEHNKTIQEKNVQIKCEIDKEVAKKNERIEKLNNHRGFWDIKKIEKDHFYFVVD